MGKKVRDKLKVGWQWLWGSAPLRANYPLPGPVILFYVSSILWPRLSIPFGVWLACYLTWCALFFPVAACISRRFATVNCLMFAIRVRVRRGGKIVIRAWSENMFSSRRCIPSFACDLGDRLVFTYQPRRATLRVYIKATGEEFAAPWEEF